MMRDIKMMPDRFQATAKHHKGKTCMILHNGKMPRYDCHQPMINFKLSLILSRYY